MRSVYRSGGGVVVVVVSEPLVVVSGVVVSGVVVSGVVVSGGGVVPGLVVDGQSGPVVPSGQVLIVSPVDGVVRSPEPVSSVEPVSGLLVAPPASARLLVPVSVSVLDPVLGVLLVVVPLSSSDCMLVQAPRPAQAMAAAATAIQSRLFMNHLICVATVTERR